MNPLPARDKSCDDLLSDPTTEQGLPRRYPTPRELMRLPKIERDRIMAESAELAVRDYADDSTWRDFEAYGEKDSYD